MDLPVPDRCESAVGLIWRGSSAYWGRRQLQGDWVVVSSGMDGGGLNISNLAAQIAASAWLMIVESPRGGLLGQLWRAKRGGALLWPGYSLGAGIAPLGTAAGPSRQKKRMPRRRAPVPAQSPDIRRQ